VGLDTTDDQILGLEIVRLTGGLAQVVGVLEQGLMAVDEVGHIVFGRSGFDRHLGDAGETGEGLESAGSEDVESAKTLGDVVHSGEKFLVLALEGDVELEEVRTFDIPVSQMSLSHQGIGISEKGLEMFDDRGSGGGCGLRFHPR